MSGMWTEDRYNGLGDNMLQVFYEMLEVLKEVRDLTVKMEKHLNDLTLPPDMKEWSKRLKDELDKTNKEN